ncbi:hypothetical protein PsYK624_015250 [Phanerochaete sordida]|uniref:Uncharacterized protein n=1 Tax=Phanerochaete sordida TaxID=48140 RepID=A0A9P3FZG0_9APHY|nr:hypothetical protein PsYK624_015250 [Phanerochaete sordida]
MDYALNERPAAASAAEYLPLSQDDDVHPKERTLGAATAKIALWMSPAAMAVAFATLVLVNAMCLLFTMHQVNVVHGALKDRLEFVANHDLRQIRSL